MRSLDIGLARFALKTSGHAIVIYDASDRIEAFNRRYETLCGSFRTEIELGVTWEDVVRGNLRSGDLPEALGREEEWLRERCAQRGRLTATRHHPSGISYHITEQRLAGQGIVVVCRDIDKTISPEAQTLADRRLLSRYWRGQGLSVRAYSTLAFAGCGSVDDVRRLGRAYFARVVNCGRVTLDELERLVGGWNEAPARVARRPAPVAKAAVGKAGPMTRQERTAPGLIVAPPVQLSAYRRLRYLVDLSTGGGVPTQRRAEPGGQVLPFRGRGGAI